MKSLLSILSALLDDASSSLGADTSRDRETILERVEHEGDAFFYITLPEFGQWIEQSIESNGVLASIYSRFRKRPGSTNSVLPCFLQGLTRLVFDEHSGSLRSDASATAVFFLRQICYLYKKPKALASRKRIAKAISQYRETETEVRTFQRKYGKRLRPDNLWSSERATPLPLRAEKHCKGYTYWAMDTAVENVCKRILPRLESLYLEARRSCYPKHGPGATADKKVGNAKFNVRGWYERWNSIFFHEELYGYPIEMEEDLDVISRNHESPVKVIPVPKTYKTSRIISIEPTAMQYAQQYVLSKMVYAIERSQLGSVIKLSDQSQNRKLARKGSQPGRYFSTIDLSEASDRVSAALVKKLLSRHCPSLCRELFAVRSSRALVDGEEIILSKYASMGSATTFPVESVIFAILAIAAVADNMRDFVVPCDKYGNGMFRTHDRWSWSTVLRKATTLVSVFGDDIIVPSTAFSKVCCYLEANGLKVNDKKSFAQGRFKESCGGDFFDGVDVTPAYCRTEAPSRPGEADKLVSFVSLSNQLYEKGCWRASDVVKSMVEEIIGKLPLRRSEAGYLGWSTFKNVTQFEGFDSNFSPWVRSYTVVSRKVSDNLNGHSALLKHFLAKAPQEEEDHLEQSVKRHSTRIRRRRCAV